MTTAAQRNPAPPAPPEGRDWTAQPFGTFADEVDENALLARAAEILQRRSTVTPEPDPIPPKSIKAGGSVLIHVLTHFSRDSWKNDKHERGAELTVAYDDVSGPDWSDHRTGQNKFDSLLADGRSIAVGPWPRHLTLWDFGDDQWQAARRAAVHEASQHRDAEACTEAMRAVVDRFGQSSFTPSTAAKFYARKYADPAAHEYARKNMEATS